MCGLFPMRSLRNYNGSAPRGREVLTIVSARSGGQRADIDVTSQGKMVLRTRFLRSGRPPAHQQRV
jgi:hypothetical protein